MNEKLKVVQLTEVFPEKKKCWLIIPPKGYSLPLFSTAWAYHTDEPRVYGIGKGQAETMEFARRQSGRLFKERA